MRFFFFFCLISEVVLIVGAGRTLVDANLHIALDVLGHWLPVLALHTSEAIRVEIVRANLDWERRCDMASPSDPSPRRIINVSFKVTWFIHTSTCQFTAPFTCASFSLMLSSTHLTNLSFFNTRKTPTPSVDISLVTASRQCIKSQRSTDHAILSEEVPTFLLSNLLQQIARQRNGPALS